ncbi:hypothetical protein NBRC10512_005001 [Rhodotorula toruloides]|uniref:RHTO0S01e14730g1_1 n=2 Tax=Rhodotorula toruloides TaxID=5286 RepID=A0A061AN10_RHOTO|nr:protein of unknown function DUF155 [Rhodotorula toruloides NP11]EMS24432.1 protein of unknown function DUF155 [Rhodotorula toruloides NP11]CDR36122.1 RHTO0S01e14730g1_1 [Rhodotorula toruloides]
MAARRGLGLLGLLAQTRTTAHAVPQRLAPSLVAHSSSSSARLTSPTSTTPPRPQSPAGLQRPQKHKAKKSKSGKEQPWRKTRQSFDAPLLPVGLRTRSTGWERPADGKVIALTTAESYNTTELLRTLQDQGLLEGAVNLLGEAILLPRWSPASATFFDPDNLLSDPAQQESGEVYIFESGTIVLWGLSMQAAETFLRKVIRGGSQKFGFVEIGRYGEPETEVLEYWVGNGSTRMAGDSIILSSAPSAAAPSSDSSFPSLQTLISTQPDASHPIPPSKELLERLAFSAGMARVTKLGVYEEQFDAFAEGVARIPKLLETGSEAPVKKTDIIKRFGTLHSFRQKLNLEDENLLDEPEFLWEDGDLHGHYTAICKALEFENRLRTLNDRVDYAFSLQTTLMELLNARVSHRLEWIIIILIAFEISLVLYREGLPFLNSHSEEDPSRAASV